MKTEHEILTRAKEGDRDAMAAIIENNQKKIFSLAYRMTGNREDALDIAQDTFVKAMTNIGKFRGDSSVSTWLYSIAANLSRDHLRKHANRFSVPLEEAWICTGEDSPLEIAEEKDRRELVRRAVGSLPPAMRAAFSLRYNENLSISEIAQALGKSEGTIKAQISQSVGKIQKFLKL